MDNKPLLQDGPPAYNNVPGAQEYGLPQHGYGAIPPTAPPPYQYPGGPGKSPCFLRDMNVAPKVNSGGTRARAPARFIFLLK